MKPTKKPKKKGNDLKCNEIKENLNQVSAGIKFYDDKTRMMKKMIKQWDQEKREHNAQKRNLMLKYGRSKDIIVNAFIPNPYIAIAKTLYDVHDAPSGEDIEFHMNKIKELDTKIKAKEQEIFNLGQKIRELYKERDELMRAWQYSECGKR